MKVGTVPKITIGVIALIALVYIGSKQLMAPKEDAALSVQAVAPPGRSARGFKRRSAPVSRRKGRGIFAGS